MTNLKPYVSQIVTGVVVLILCFAAFMAWNEWMREEVVYVPANQEEIARLTNELAVSAQTKKKLYQAILDGLSYDNDNLQVLLADTLTALGITTQYDEARQNHRALNTDSAVGLAAYRLRNENVYGARFDYSILSD